MAEGASGLKPCSHGTNTMLMLSPELHSCVDL